MLWTNEVDVLATLIAILAFVRPAYFKTVLQFV